VSGRGENLTVRSYTVAEGLAHDHVSRIYRDSHGFLWICTDEGLSRFDGHAFVNYTAESGLPHIHVNDIVETRGGDYWVATDGGVTLFRPGHASQKFRTYKPEGPPQALFTNAVAEEASGAVLVGTAAGLYRLYPNDGSARLERIEFGAPPDYHLGYSVNTLYIDRNGTLWVGAVSGLYRRDTRGTWLRLASQDGLPFDFVHRIVADTAGRIWICTRFGLARLAQPLQPGKPAVDMTLTDKNGLPHRDVRDILVSPDGRRWICTLGGLVEWRPESPTPLVFRVYASGNGLTDPEVYAIETDPDGNIWIGTRRGGLMRLSRMGFQTFRETEGIMLSGEDSIVETRTGAICIAAILDPRRSIRCFDGRRFNLTVPLLPTPGYDRRLPSRSQSTVVDHLGDWWISTAIGLFRFRSLTGGEPGATADLRLLPARESRHLYEDAHGDLWITTLSTENFGLVRWERATSQLHD